MHKKERILQDRFCLVKPLGQGSQGCVYLAWDMKLDKYWAVKELRGKDIREAEIMRRLDHPGLPRIVDILEEKGCRYLVMDYVEGFTLEEIRNRKKVNWKQKIDWGIQLCSLLEYLHGPAKGIIYQDLKPSNIIIRLSGDLCLLDFGIAGLRETGAGTGYGTKGYAAPEQYLGTADELTDIYGLGAVLLCLTDRKEPKNRWYREWKRIAARCMDEKPSRRYPSAVAVRKELQRLERLRQGRKRVYVGTVFAAAGLLFLLNAGINEKQSALDAGFLMMEKNIGEWTDTADYVEAKQYFLKDRTHSKSREEYRIILDELGKESRDADWKKVKESVEELEKAEEDSWERGRENVFLAQIYQAYGADMGLSTDESLKKASQLLHIAEQLVEKNKSQTFAPVYRVEIQYQLAKNYERQEKTEESLACYEKLLQEKIPGELKREVYLSMASLYRIRQEYKKAEDTYEVLLELFPKESEPYCAYALMEAMERGNPEKAEKIMGQMEEEKAETEGFNTEKVQRILQKLREEEIK